MERPGRQQQSALVAMAVFLFIAIVIAAGMAACGGGSKPAPMPGRDVYSPEYDMYKASLAQGPETSGPPETGPTRDVSVCTALLNLQLKDTTITDATVVPAKGNLPEYCRVEGAIENVILFEVGLPTKAWNGKLYYSGGGGYNGTIPALTDGLMRGYAAVGSDTGHRGEHWDASALYKKPQVQINYAHRGAHLTTVITKDIVKAYYGKPQERAYFMGCSNGGKMGLMEAQRYPDDYDGIVAGASPLARTVEMAWLNWTQKALVGAEIPPRKIPAMEKATLAACDAADGLKDGLIDRPDVYCRFDPAVLTCKGADGPDCLTPAQVTAWKKILEGPKSSTGKQLDLVGYYPGHEDDYPAYITGFGNMSGYPSSNFMYQDAFMRWFVFGPDYDSVRQFDWDKDIAKVTAYAKDQDADNTDLSRFKAHGGKLILTHGWADHSSLPSRTIDYYDEVRKLNGSTTDDFARLFIFPGLHHCSGGPGPNTFGLRGHPKVPNDAAHADQDIMTLLDQWVEKGVAPTKVIATKFKNDDPKQGVQRTRPACAYPQMAKYKGAGSVDDAANFVCAAVADRQTR